MANETKIGRPLFFIVFAVFVVASITMYVMDSTVDYAENPVQSQTGITAPDSINADNADGNLPEEAWDRAEPIVNSETMSKPVDFSFDAVVAPRVFGDKDAFLTITEHSSYTCPHCASFHANIYPDLIKNYVDVGLAKIVFEEIIFNQIDLRAAVTARCFDDNDTFFAFSNMLFATQEEWARSPHAEEILRSKALSYGISEAKLDYCYGSIDGIGKVLLQTMRDARNDHGITSTPSFVVNNEHVMRGIGSYEMMDAQLKTYLPAEVRAFKEQNAVQTAPVVEPESAVEEISEESPTEAPSETLAEETSEENPAEEAPAETPAEESEEELSE